jgi:hypothetical protein
LAPFCPIWRLLKSLCRGLPGPKNEILTAVIQKSLAKVSVLAPFCPTWRFLKSLCKGLPVPQICPSNLKSFKSCFPRSQVGIFRSDPAFSPKLVPRAIPARNKHELRSYSRSEVSFANVSFWHLSVRPGVLSKARAKAYLDPSNMNFVAKAVQKICFLSTHFGTFRSDPALFSKARAKAYPALLK